MEKGSHCVHNNMKAMTKKLGEVRNTVKVVVLEGDHVAKDYLVFYSKIPNLFISPYSYGG